MGSFNFLPHRDWALAQRRQWLVRCWMGSAGLALAGLLLVHAWMEHQVDGQRQVHGVLQMGLHQLAMNREKLATLQPSLEEVQIHLDAIQDLQLGRNASVHLLNQLLPLMPAGLHLTQLSLTGLQTEIQGQAEEQNLVAQFFHALHQSATFSQVEWLDLARQTEPGQAPDLDFRLRARLVLRPVTP